MTHSEAREIVRQAWRRVHGRDPTDRELAYTQAIASLETGYGRAGQFGALAARGQYNWGALERRRLPSGECPDGTAAGTDEGPVCFYVFPSDVEAAAAFIRNLTTRHWPTLQAMNQGEAEDVARAMREPPAYYTGIAGSEDEKVRAYANGIRTQLRAIGAGGLEVPEAARSVIAPVLLLGVLGAGGYLLATRAGLGRELVRRRLPRLT